MYSEMYGDVSEAGVKLPTNNPVNFPGSDVPAYYIEALPSCSLDIRTLYALAR